MNERALLVRFGADLSPLERAVIEAAKTAKAFGKEIEGLGKSLTSGITEPLMKLGSSSVDASESVDDALDRIRLGTGATGEDLEKMGDSFRTVLGEVPESALQVSTAITELSRRTGLAGGGLEAMTTQMLELSRVAGSDVGPLIQSTQKTFANWGVATKDQATALDYLWKVSQSTGVGVGQLADTMGTSGATLRALGLNFETSAALIGGFEKRGVDAGTVIAGLTKGATAFAKEGKSMEEGLKGAIDKIREARSPAEASKLAVETFGKSGVAMADAIQRSGLSVDGLVQSLRSSTETIHKAADDTAGLGEAYGTLGNKVTKALEPLGVAITKVLIDLMGVMSSLIDSVIAPAARAFGALPEPIQSAAVMMGGLVAAIGPVLVAVGGLITTVAGIGTAMVSVSATLAPAMAGITALFPAAAAAITGAWAGLTGVFAGTGGVAAVAASGVTGIGAALASFATGPVVAAVAAIALVALKWDFVRETLITGAQLIKAGFDASWTAVSTSTRTLWESVSTTVTTSVASAVSQTTAMGGALVTAAKTSMEPYTATVTQGIEKTSALASGMWDSTKSAASAAGSWILKQLQSVLDGVGSIVGQIVDAVKNVVNYVSNAVSDIAQKLSKAMSDAQAAKRAADDAAASAADTASFQVVDAANKLWPPKSTGGKVLAGRAGGAKDIIVGENGATFSSGGSSNVRDIQIGAGTTYSNAAVLHGEGAPPTPTNKTPTPTGYSPTNPWGAYTPPALNTYTPPPTSSYGGTGGSNNSPYLTPPVTSGDSPFSGRRTNDIKIDRESERARKLQELSELSASRASVAYLAEGGVVTQPTLAMIGEGGESEAVIPLSRLGAMMGEGGGGTIINLVVHVNGSVRSTRELAKEFAKPLRDEIERLKRDSGDGFR